MATNSNLPVDAGRYNAFYLSPLKINFRFPEGTDLDLISVKIPSVRTELLPDEIRDGVLYSIAWDEEKVRLIPQYFSVFLFKESKAFGSVSVVVYRDAGEPSEHDYTIINNATNAMYFISDEGDTVTIELGDEATSQDGTYEFMGVTLNTLDITTN